MKPPAATPTKPDAPLVDAERLTRVFPSGEREVRALDGIGFQVLPGECVGVVGRSGSGKSTLLNLLGGLDRASSGTLRVGGRDLAGMTRKQLAAYRSHEIGVIFQAFQLLPALTALDNVALGLRFQPVTREDRYRRARQMLEHVGLADRAHHRPDSLSGGEKQRVAIARALVKQPSLLLADEPTGNLDRDTTKAIEALLVDLHHSGQTIVLVTHDLEMAGRICDRVLRLDYGVLRNGEATE